MRSLLQSFLSFVVYEIFTFNSFQAIKVNENNCILELIKTIFESRGAFNEEIFEFLKCVNISKNYFIDYSPSSQNKTL